MGSDILCSSLRQVHVAVSKVCHYNILLQLRFYKQLYNEQIAVTANIFIVNPRRACAARVTVVGSVCVFVCLSVCYSTSRFSNVYSSHKRYDLLNGR